MRHLLPPHLEGWQPAPTDPPPDESDNGEEHHVLSSGAVLLLDAEGSTELAARLRVPGTLGAGPADTLLGQIFEAVVDAVAEAGGYVGHFTGDGVIAVFQDEPTDAVANAVAAGRTILKHIADLSGLVTPAGPVDLAVRAIVGAGTIDTFVWRAPAVSDPGCQNAVYVIVGTALAEAQRGEEFVEGGVLALGPQAASALPEVEYVPIDDGGLGYVSISSAEPILDQTSRVTQPASATDTAAATAAAPITSDWRFVIPGAFDEEVQPEFRYATVAFLELKEWPHEDTVAVIIEEMAASGGHISNVLRTSADQLGVTFMLVWGAPVGHPDDASRALRFVEAVQNEIGADTFKTGVGYSYTFIGFVGSDAQSTYTALGAPVNLAARLCSIADWGEIRVTEVFDEVIPPGWVVEPVEATVYKGFKAPLVTRSLRPAEIKAPRWRVWPRRRHAASSTAPLIEEVGDDSPPQDPLIDEALTDLQARAAGRTPPS